MTRLNLMPEKILVRAPNWLGDTIMSAGFFHRLAGIFPESDIDVVVDEKLVDIVRWIPVVSHIYGYSRKGGNHLESIFRFPRQISARKKYDLFFTLPDSFSSALMGYLTRSRQRIGYKGDFRTLLLTHPSVKPVGLHRVEEYAYLLTPFSVDATKDLDVSLRLPHSRSASVPIPSDKPVWIYHMNSEADSRRVPLEKAVSIARALIAALNCHLFLTGTEKDKEYNRQLRSGISHGDNVRDLAGKTSLYELADLMTRVQGVISTDSGTAHLANSLGADVVVLWGPADPANTAPYAKKNLRLIRDTRLPCVPCVKNVCRFGTNQCLLDIDEKMVLESVRLLSEGKGARPL